MSPDVHRFSTLALSGADDTRQMGTAIQQVEVVRVGEERFDTAREVVFDIDDLAVHYGKTAAFSGVTLDIFKQQITAVIGPSGCGKSTFIRCLNRMNDLVGSAKVDGTILYHGEDIHDGDVDPVELRRRIGMVFQRANPFPKSDLRQRRFRPEDARDARRT